MKSKKNLPSWGNYPKAKNVAQHLQDIPQLKNYLEETSLFIPYGNGRSYGDSALQDDILHVRPYNYFLGFDKKTGILHCQAGVLLSEILELFVPLGWFLGVTPGTKFVTIGGAIASDIHGKNHHIKGSFSDTLISLELMLPDGSIVNVSHTENDELFRATCGGMGLTGIILTAKLQLQPIESAVIDETIVKTANLKETFAAFEEYKKYSYSVAWIDCLAKGDKLGRCLLMLGEHAQEPTLAKQNYIERRGPTVPRYFPSAALNSFSIKAFNSIYYHKVRGSKIHLKKSSIDSFFYPLDALQHWNRIYGHNGFLQYQLVLPLAQSYTGLETILKKIANAGLGSFLAVLKCFGKGNANYLSFPLEGYTLALDFKINRNIFSFLNELDEIVASHDGRIYLAKDARMSRLLFEKGYKATGSSPLTKFRELRKKFQMNRKLNSWQSQRLGI